MKCLRNFHQKNVFFFVFVYSRFLMNPKNDSIVVYFYSFLVFISLANLAKKKKPVKRFKKFAFIMKLEIENRFFEPTTKFVFPQLSSKKRFFINKQDVLQASPKNKLKSVSLSSKKSKVRQTKKKEQETNIEATLLFFT